jgi:hypothetical protein
LNKVFRIGATVRAPLQMRQAPPRWAEPQLDRDLHAYHCRALYIEIAQSFCHRTDVTAADYVLINFGDADEFAHRSGAKHFVGAINVAAMRPTTFNNDVVYFDPGSA